MQLRKSFHKWKKPAFPSKTVHPEIGPHNHLQFFGSKITQSSLLRDQWVENCTWFIACQVIQEREKSCRKSMRIWWQFWICKKIVRMAQNNDQNRASHRFDTRKKCPTIVSTVTRSDNIIWLLRAIMWQPTIQ